MTTRRRAARLAEQQLTRERLAAVHDARALALEVGRGQPRTPFEPMAAGVVLWPAEAVYRQAGLWVSALDHGVWAAPSWANILVTDQRLLCRFGSGALASLPWRGLVGLHIDLPNERVAVDHGDGQPVVLSGPAAPVVAVASIAFTYGIASLLTHHELDVLRSPGVNGQDAA